MFHQCNRATFGRLGRDVTNRQTRCAARETSICHQCTRRTQSFRFQITGWIQHFLHSGAATWTFVKDHNDIAFFDLTCQNIVHGIILAFYNICRAGKLQDAFVNTCSFYDATVFCNVAEQNSKSTILRKGVFFVADHATRAVHVKCGVFVGLRKRLRRANATGCSTIKIMYFGVVCAHDIPVVQCIAHCW